MYHAVIHQDHHTGDVRIKEQKSFAECLQVLETVRLEDPEGVAFITSTPTRSDAMRAHSWWFGRAVP